MEHLDLGNLSFYKSVGILRYSPADAPLLKLIVEVDPEISRYYRSLVPKSIWHRPQMWPAHISVIRKEIPPNMAAWGKYDGQEIEFEYTNAVYIGANYCWLNVFCKRLEEIRAELGLAVHSLYTIPPEGFDKVFHCTIANLKEK